MYKGKRVQKNFDKEVKFLEANGYNIEGAIARKIKK